MTRLRDTTPRLAPTSDATTTSLGFEVPPWMDHAACGPDTADLFFPTSTASAASIDALAICDTCPVRDECLDYARDIETGTGKLDVVGIWGGLTDTDRRASRTPQNTCRDCGQPIAPGFTYCKPHRDDHRRAVNRASERRRTWARREVAS